MKIWIVEEGCYSDRCVAGVFTTEEKAKEMQMLLPDSDITAWEVDVIPDHPQGCLMWAVEFNRDGLIRFGPDKRSPNDYLGWKQSVRIHDGFAYLNLWARDEAHAVKIAGEVRARLIATGEWPE